MFSPECPWSETLGCNVEKECKSELSKQKWDERDHLPPRSLPQSQQGWTAWAWQTAWFVWRKPWKWTWKENTFFHLNMLSHWVVQWESWEVGADEHCPNFPKGPFQLSNRWACGTAHVEKLGYSLVSCHAANAHLCLLYSSGLRTAFLLLLLISATWLLGLMAVNSDVMTFHYLFAIFSCLQVSWMAFCPWQTLPWWAHCCTQSSKNLLT